MEYGGWMVVCVHNKQMLLSLYGFSVYGSFTILQPKAVEVQNCLQM